MFTTVSKPSTEDASKAEVSIDVGKTLAGMLLGLAVLAGALVLYLNDLEAPAAAFFALGEAIAVGVLGIAVGEKSGGNQAIATLGD